MIAIGEKSCLPVMDSTQGTEESNDYDHSLTDVEEDDAPEDISFKQSKVDAIISFKQIQNSLLR